jgi:hypothetical protein
MNLIRKRATVVLGAIALTAAAARPAHAQVFPGFPSAAGAGASPCATSTTGQISGAPLISSCQGPGALSFVGPSIGQIATTIGPINIGPVLIGQQVVSTGPVVTPFP